MTGRVHLLLAGAMAVVTLAGCASEDLPTLGMPERGVTLEADRILSLWQGSWVAALATGAVVWGLILWSAAFHRKRRGDDSLPPQVRYNIPVEVLYTLLPFVMISVFFFYTARDEAALRDLDDASVEHTIEVMAFQWSWQFNYVDEDAGTSVSGTPGVPPTLVLPQGERVRFVLNSNDVIHSFWVPAFLFKMDVLPGRTNMFEVTPEKVGSYVGKCAELCGTDHSRMLFNVEIVEADDYDQRIAEIQEANA
jgi:cytochrome c oxidase subunit 2